MEAPAGDSTVTVSVWPPLLSTALFPVVVTSARVCMIQAGSEVPFTFNSSCMTTKGLGPRTIITPRIRGLA